MLAVCVASAGRSQGRSTTSIHLCVGCSRIEAHMSAIDTTRVPDDRRGGRSLLCPEGTRDFRVGDPRSPSRARVLLVDGDCSRKDRGNSIGARILSRQATGRGHRRLLDSSQVLLIAQFHPRV